MQQIVATKFGAPDVLRLREAASPEPGPTQVQIEVHAAGVNPADTYVRSGSYEFLRPNPPFVPGFDAAGVVSEVGSEVDQFASGDRVYVSTIVSRSMGAYSQTLVCEAAAVQALPESLSFEQGAAIGVPFTTAYRSVIQRGRAKPGDVVLVHGASGGVGIPTVQLAAARGMTVIGTAGTDAGRALVLENGASFALDHTQRDYLTAIDQLTSGRGIDLVVEMRADKNLQADTAILARNGRIVVVGSRGPVEVNPRSLMFKEADVRGTALWNMDAADFDESRTALADLLGAGGLIPKVGHVFPLADAAVAHDRLMTERAVGKVVLRCR